MSGRNYRTKSRHAGSEKTSRSTSRYAELDGFDLAARIGENLVDILVLGPRAFDVEVAKFKHLIGESAIQVFPCIDAFHTPDGYGNPPMDVYRGVLARMRIFILL